MFQSLITLPLLLGAPAATPAEPVVVERPAADESSGEVTRVDHEKNVFAIRVGEEETLRLKMDNNTKFYRGEKEITAKQALKIGAQVTVEHADGTASKVTLAADDEA